MHVTTWRWGLLHIDVVNIKCEYCTAVYILAWIPSLSCSVLAHTRAWHIRSHNGCKVDSDWDLVETCNQFTYALTCDVFRMSASHGVPRARLEHVCVCNIPQVMTLLIEKNSPIDACDASELTPLHYACQRDRVGCVLVLLNHGADINRCDTAGRTPLHLCAINGHERSAKAIVWHTPATLRLDARDMDGNTALHLAAKWGYVPLVELLLLSGADRTVSNAKGQVCARGCGCVLAWVCMHGRVGVCDGCVRMWLGTCGCSSVYSRAGGMQESMCVSGKISV